MTIHTYEKNGRGEACAAYLKGCLSEEDFTNVVVLPIPSVVGDGLIKGTDTPIKSIATNLDGRTLVVGYGIPTDAARCFCERGCVVCDCGLDEEFLVANADLTAVATLGILLTTESRVPKDMKIGIVGYGRIGKRLTSMLLYLGAEVVVYTSRHKTRLDLGEMGVATQISAAEADLSGIDLLINTAPAVIFDTSHGGIPPSLRIIDLASGDNFPGKEVEKYPSIPAKMFPYSSGRIYGESVERLLLGGGVLYE